MIHLRTILATSAISVLCTIVVNCGGDESNDDNSNTSATDSGTDSLSVIDDGSTSSNDSSADSSIVDGALDASNDADAGPVFSADCGGQVAFGPGQVDWTYSVTDDGMSSYAKVTVKGVGFALDCSKDGTFADPSQPATGPRDVLAFVCSSANWTAGLDRNTMVVYLGADNGAGPSSALSWTPNCH
ncbi:MAG: hypothetical protein KF850_20050 [Labilithrix sp.]|nr:hypothetical protein [Labilithrix sp.]